MKLNAINYNCNKYARDATCYSMGLDADHCWSSIWTHTWTIYLLNNTFIRNIECTHCHIKHIINILKTVNTKTGEQWKIEVNSKLNKYS